ncbi:hypothetical protein VFPFJ_08006 [Purpureocillium lilacinum]|uniref:Uncharacterized protein n=1 Tax=Purpureocillium lilacinum TaxID=33203 RepID=A0A179H635_PURLI|nr:hypothetical protein VFPFJ_08006 [Purpureocillium lilacinum]OAQ85617.1 hypothetical protein VFPFJ_08006 [Purpureocillium lilacinum]
MGADIFACRGLRKRDNKRLPRMWHDGPGEAWVTFASNWRAAHEQERLNGVLVARTRLIDVIDNRTQRSLAFEDLERPNVTGLSVQSSRDQPSR